MNAWAATDEPLSGTVKLDTPPQGDDKKKTETPTEKQKQKATANTAKGESAEKKGGEKAAKGTKSY